MSEQELIDVQPKTAEIVKAEPQALAINPDAPLMVQVMQMAASGITLDTDMVKAMQDIVRQQKADDAKAVYASDFADAQSGIASAIKTAYNPQTKSNYADLGCVIESSRPVYTKCGFSVAFSEGVAKDEGNVRVCAAVSHRDGHEKTYFLDVPLGGKGIAGKVNMIDIHAKATSLTYGRRYLLCMIWNIPTSDNDGNQPPAPPAKPIEIPKPNENEKKVIDQICYEMPHVDGMTPSPAKIGRLFYVNGEKRDYPSDPTTVIAICEWLVKSFEDSQMYDEVK